MACHVAHSWDAQLEGLGLGVCDNSFDGFHELFALKDWGTIFGVVCEGYHVRACFGLRNGADYERDVGAAFEVEFGVETLKLRAWMGRIVFHGHVSSSGPVIAVVKLWLWKLNNC